MVRVQPPPNSTSAEMGIKSLRQFPFRHVNLPTTRSPLFTGPKIFPSLIFSARVDAAILTFTADGNSERTGHPDELGANHRSRFGVVLANHREEVAHHEEGVVLYSESVRKRQVRDEVGSNRRSRGGVIFANRASAVTWIVPFTTKRVLPFTSSPMGIPSPVMKLASITAPVLWSYSRSQNPGYNRTS